MDVLKTYYAINWILNYLLDTLRQKYIYAKLLLFLVGVVVIFVVVVLSIIDLFVTLPLIL